MSTPGPTSSWSSPVTTATKPSATAAGATNDASTTSVPSCPTCSSRQRTTADWPGQGPNGLEAATSRPEPATGTAGDGLRQPDQATSLPTTQRSGPASGNSPCLDPEVCGSKLLGGDPL